MSDLDDNELSSGGNEDDDLSQVDALQLGWYQKGIFRYFEFSEEENKTKPDGFVNLYPKCKVKGCNRHISTQIKVWGNLERHLKVR